MIDSAEIQNFRGFERVELSGLARVNVIVGDNGSGKTGLLEALWMGSGSNAEIPLRLKRWRGADIAAGTGTPQEVYDGMFLDLFHWFKKGLVPSVSLISSTGVSRFLRLYYDTAEPTLLPFGEEPARHAQPSAFVPVAFEWMDADGRITKVTPEIRQDGIVVPAPVMLRHDPTFLAARTPFPTAQNARWFSEFSKRGDEGQFIRAMQDQFPYVETLTVEVDMGNPVIFAKVPWFERKMPIYLLSDGMNKFLTILLHIAYSSHTACFIDEIENGFHFQRHETLWSQMLSFANDYKTQVFVTTHSWEFLKAAVPILEQNADNFAMIQVFQEQGVGRAILVSGDKMADALKSQIEVRK